MVMSRTLPGADQATRIGRRVHRLSMILATPPPTKTAVTQDENRPGPASIATAA